VRLADAADDDLVEMPDIAAAGLLALEVASEIPAEFESPTPHGSRWTQVFPRSYRHFLDEAQAQWNPIALGEVFVVQGRSPAGGSGSGARRAGRLFD